MLNFFDSHTHKKNQTHSIYNLELQDSPINFPFSCGLHPWKVQNHFHFQLIEKLASHPHCVAIGEIGLDKLYPETYDLQQVFFKKQLQLAIKLKKPVIVHAVKSYSDIHSILKEINFKLPILFHDFNGSPELVQQLLHFDSYFGYGVKLFNEKTKGYQTLKHIEMKRILLETDDSSLLIKDVYEQCAKLLHYDLSELTRIINENASHFLGKNLIDNK